MSHEKPFQPFVKKRNHCKNAFLAIGGGLFALLVMFFVTSIDRDDRPSRSAIPTAQSVPTSIPIPTTRVNVPTPKPRPPTRVPTADPNPILTAIAATLTAEYEELPLDEQWERNIKSANDLVNRFQALVERQRLGWIVSCPTGPMDEWLAVWEPHAAAMNVATDDPVDTKRLLDDGWEMIRETEDACIEAK